MSESRVKKIRQKVYGDFSPKARTYRRDEKTGQITADPKRRMYQMLKGRRRNVKIK